MNVELEVIDVDVAQVCHACLQPFLKAHQEASNPCLQRHENYEIKKPKVTIEQLEMDITAYKLLGPTGSEESEECSVCLMEYEPGEAVCRPRVCVHQFHAKCIKSWLEKNGRTCPLCRTTFIRKDQELVVVE